MPKTMSLGVTHGLSNGSINEWNKVSQGQQAFELEYRKAENEVILVPQNELHKFMEQFSKSIHILMLNDQL